MADFILSPLFAGYKPRDRRGRVVQIFISPLIGQKFNRLTVVAMIPENQNKLTSYLCLCDCGGTAHVSGPHLKSGHTKSCGCYASESASKRMTTHGATRPTIYGKKRKREYSLWNAMMTRCYSSRCKHFKDYGGRGIKVHPELQKYEGFIAHLGDSNGLSLERFDVNDDYAPGNVGWVPWKEQAKNTRKSVFVTFNGEKLNIYEALTKANKSKPKYYKILKEVKDVQKSFDLAPVQKTIVEAK